MEPCVIRVLSFVLFLFLLVVFFDSSMVFPGYPGVTYYLDNIDEFSEYVQTCAGPNAEYAKGKECIKAAAAGDTLAALNEREPHKAKAEDSWLGSSQTGQSKSTGTPMSAANKGVESWTGINPTGKQEGFLKDSPQAIKAESSWAVSK